MLRVKKNDVAVVPIFDPPKTSAIPNAFTGKVEGLIIPDIAKERSDQGIVKYIGKDVDDIYYGDHVMFAAYDGTLTNLSGEGLLIILPADKIVAIIHPPETQIKGVYFKSPLELDEIEQQLAEIMRVAGCSREAAIELHRDYGYRKDEYFPATYEMSIELIADAITAADWKDKYRFKDRKLASPSASKVF